MNLMFFSHESIDHANEVEAVVDHAVSPAVIITIAAVLLALAIAARISSRSSDDK